MRLLRIFALATAFTAPALIASATQLDAQSTSSLAGKWDVEYERGRQVENGTVTPIMGKGTLTVSISGDSVTAVLQGGPRPDGSPTPPSTLTGKLRDGGAVLTSKRQVRLNENGEESVRELTLTWTLKSSGDTLSGSMTQRFPNMAAEPEPSSVKGTRAKS